MTHVITQACCNDASCVPVCPVGCIHPGPSELGFAKTEMLYIDPATCIDCGACVSACPVQAIVPDTALDEATSSYLQINAAFYAKAPINPALERVDIPVPAEALGAGTLRVAIIGSGPAGSYAAEELLRYPNVEVDMFDRLPTPWGLVRAGVAPDHVSTKAITNLFERTADNIRFRFHLNVEVGKHISHAELLRHHHAVIYAHGASTDRRLHIPGEDLPGSVAAAQFVNWYNGHPDFSDQVFDLSGSRAAIIGNGNVALDIARMLAMNSDDLAATDIAPHAIAALRESAIEEIVVIGRRGPMEAAYTTPELLALGSLSGVDVIADENEIECDPMGSHSLALQKLEIAARYARTRSVNGRRRIRLRYLTAPVEIIGDDRVSGLRLERNRLERFPSGDMRAVPTGEYEVLETGLVIRSIGYRGRVMPGLPFDEKSGVVPNIEGRVTSGGLSQTGVYVTGWIKRGPSGVIGTNRQCAKQTVSHLIADFKAGRLANPLGSRDNLSMLVRQIQSAVTDLAGWRAIDDAERRAGEAHGAPRRKFTSVSDMLEVAERWRAAP